MVEVEENFVHLADASEINIASREMNRLRDLNSDCQLAIIKYLSVVDLLSLCDFDGCLKDLIGDHIIPKLLIDCRDRSNWETIKLFELFGEKIRRIKMNFVYENVEFIIRHCKPAQLIELHLGFCYSIQDDDDLLRRVMPYFTNLKKLALLSNKCDATIFMKLLCSEPAFNPKVLHLVHVKINDTWTQSRSLDNLEEIRIVERRSSTGLIDFLQNKAKMKSLRYIGVESELSAALSCCKQLKDYSYMSFQSVPCETRINDEIIYEALCQSSFKYLKITSHASDVSDLPSLLPTSNSAIMLECLRIQISNTYTPTMLANSKATGLKCLDKWNAKAFENLTTVRIEVETVRGEILCLSKLEILCRFLSRLKNLKTVAIKCKSPIVMHDFHNFLEHIPNIETLDMVNIAVQKFRIAPMLKDLASDLKKLQEIKPNQKQPIHLLCNDKQFHELEVSNYFYGNFY